MLFVMGRRAKRKETVLRLVVLAVLYAAVAKLGLGLDAVSGFATLVWPPTGLSLAALLLFGFRLWPGVFLGAWAVNIWAGAPVVVAFGIAIGNTLEAVLGAYLLRKWGGFRGTFDSLRHVIGLVLAAAMLSTLVSATLGVVSLGLGRIVQSWHQALATWRAWWIGDVLGDLVVAPLLLTWLRMGDHVVPHAARFAEAAALTILLGLASWAIFFRSGLPIYPFESSYVLFPLFAYAALRFELLGATLATVLASIVAIWGTARGSGPFAREALASALLALQTFLGCAAITPLIVAGAMMDRARAVRLRETFVATVSHDLKNPLNTLRLSGASLLRNPAEEVVKKHYQLLNRSLDRMTRLVTDLLDAAAIERGQLSVEKKLEDSRAMVNEAVDLLRPLAAVKKLSLRPQEPASVEVSCDRTRILQVLSNLIENAIKFCPEGASITLTVERVPDGISFSVRDTGPGISPGDLPHVFEHYWHAKSSAGGGSGLGLFIAKGIVEAHGGRIWAESKLANGCAMSFILPVPGDVLQRSLTDRLRHQEPRH